MPFILFGADWSWLGGNGVCFVVVARDGKPWNFCGCVLYYTMCGLHEVMNPMEISA